MKDNKSNDIIYKKENIQLFNFDFLVKETFISFKQKIGVDTIEFYKYAGPNKNGTVYYKYWNNSNRVAIMIEKQVLESIKEFPQTEIDIEKRIMSANLGYYTKFLIRKHKVNEYSLEEENIDRNKENERYCS